VTVPLPPVPVPARDTDCGLLLAASVNTSVAEREPETVGLNATDAVQLAPAAKLVPQVLLEIRKSAPLVPPMAMLLIAMDDDPSFVSVTALDPPVCPTATLTQLKLAGLTAAVPVAPPPVPDNTTDCGLLDAVSAKFNAAVRAPDAVGLKTMVTVQLAEAARLAPHVCAEMLKSPAFVPEMDTLLMVMDVVPRFFSVVV